jgi:hypothetical protein
MHTNFKKARIQVKSMQSDFRISTSKLQKRREFEEFKPLESTSFSKKELLKAINYSTASTRVNPGSNEIAT